MKKKLKGAFVAIIGLCLNVILGAVKIIAGVITGSVAVIGDGINNVSDAGGSAVTLSSIALSNRGADREHPYGHGRYEYIASLIIGLIVVVVGAELFKVGLDKVLNPKTVFLNAFAYSVLAVSFAVKAFMGIFYRVHYAKSRLSQFKAVSIDSFADCAVTMAVIIGGVLNKITPLADGVVSIVVSVFIAVAGIKTVIETSGNLLGKRCDKKTRDKILSVIKNYPLIVGQHDLFVHDYGAGRRYASVHVEFLSDVTIKQAHDVIDEVERQVREDEGIELVVHCDPVNSVDPVHIAVRDCIYKTLEVYDGASAHDVNVNYKTNSVEFHVYISGKFINEKQRLTEVLSDVVKSASGFDAKIEFDFYYE